MTALSPYPRRLPSGNGGLVARSAETRQLMSLAEELKWNSQVLGRAPMPDEPVRLGDWLLTPATADSTPIPERAWERIQAIFAAGIRPQGFVLVHEAPMLLPDVAKVPTNEKPQPRPPASVGPALGAGLASASGLAAMAVAALAFVALLLPLAVMAGALTLDPILVAVTEDGYWVEIDRWNIEAAA